jgi:hypothetical protein
MNDKFSKTERIKIVEVLSASDLNPKYLSCVGMYITSWLSTPVMNKVKFIPRVLIVANAIPDSLYEYSEYLQLVDPLDIPTAFVSQTARIIEARSSSADFVITSDIDMLPLSINFESSLVNSVKPDQKSFYILRDVLEPGQFPICYNLAGPDVWGSLFDRYGSAASTQKILKEILNEFGGESGYSGIHGGQGWTIDQQALWVLIQAKAQEIEVRRFIDQQTGHRRLDRIHHRGLIRWLILPFVFLGFFHDYHVHHPVNSNQNYIRAVIWIRNLGFRVKNV